MTTETLSPIKLADAGEYSHEAHAVGFGASDSSRSLGVSEYGTTLDLYLEKTGQIEPFAGNLKTRVGKALEDVVREEFESATGIKVIESPMGLYQSAENPFVLATPDADLETGDLAEFKTTSWRMAAKLGDEGGDELPVEWLCQCQQQMYVMGRERVHVCVLVDNEYILLFQVVREEELIGHIIEAERELWQRVQDRDPPSPDWEYREILPLIRSMHGIVEAGDPVELTENAAYWWQCRKDIMQTIREKTKQADELKARVLHEIGDSSGGILPGTGKMVRRKEITKKSYTVKEQYLIDVREIKTPKHLI